MRFHVLGLVLLAGAATPALAQSSDRVERRIEKLERDLQAMRRAPGAVIEPEIRTQTQTQIGGLPATSAIADMTARVDALERQLAALTGANEENAHRIRQLEAALTQMRSDAEARAREPQPQPAVQQPTREEPAAAEPQRQPRENAAAAGTATGDPGEDAYLEGFRQWEAGDLASAQKTLEAAAKKYPKHRRASYSLNLAGRAYLDDGKPATAAKLLLSNYQTNPKGERAADSLYFLGQALLKLKKPAEACKVYDELQDVYPAMRDWVKQRLPQARAEAKCTS